MILRHFSFNHGVQGSPVGEICRIERKLPMVLEIGAVALKGTSFGAFQ